MFWLGKDFSWNQNNKGLWVFFLIPTLSVAADFIWVTFRTKVRYFAACCEFRSCGYSSLSSFARLQNMMVDTVHYFSQLMWVIGNMVWAMGELWYPGFDDTPHIMWDW
jgi:hypothetical protein